MTTPPSTPERFATPIIDPPALHVVMPAGLPATAYSARMIEALRRIGIGMTVHALPGLHPGVDPSAILAADVALSRMPDGAPVLLDGNALFNLASSLPAEDRRLRFIVLVERVRWTNPALTAEEAAVHRNLEQGALALVRRVLVPDDAVAAEVQALGVRPERLIRAAADDAGALALAEASRTA